MNANKTARVNIIRIIGHNNKKECFNEFNKMSFNDLAEHDK